MTVGISFTNGLEAIVITDSRVSGWGRHSDSVEKLGKIEKDKFNGVIFGSGSGSVIEGVIRYPDDFKGETMEDYVASINQTLMMRTNDLFRLYSENQKKEIENKARIISDDGEKKRFIKATNQEAMKRYERERNEREAFFRLIGFDNESERVRQFGFGPSAYEEIFSAHSEIGSGNDGAHWYFTTKLSGVDNKKLEAEELALFAMNAYSFATVNHGVGGTPSLAYISPKGVEIIPTQKTRVLGNLSGAYLAELPGTKLIFERTKGYFREILNVDEPRYNLIAKEIGMETEENLKSTFVPYSSWQEKANSQRFNGDKK